MHVPCTLTYTACAYLVLGEVGDSGVIELLELVLHVL